jgi:hypothetical protein
VKLAIYILSGTAAGIVVGAFLGWLGSRTGNDVRLAAGTILGLLAVAVGVAELSGHRPPLLQRNRETPQRWLHAGALRWAIMNGAALGSAFTTRLGFTLWYVVPASALLLGSPARGAAIYGTYAFARTSSAYLLLVWRGRRIDAADVTDKLRAWNRPVRGACAATLVIFGTTVVVSVGF